jgi:hypothetical protein
MLKVVVAAVGSVVRTQPAVPQRDEPADLFHPPQSVFLVGNLQMNHIHRQLRPLAGGDDF